MCKLCFYCVYVVKNGFNTFRSGLNIKLGIWNLEFET